MVQLVAKIKDMERQRDKDRVEKENETAISIQRVQRTGFNCRQTNTPGPSFSKNARTELDVEMEDGDARFVHDVMGGREKDKEVEEERPNRSNDKGKKKTPVNNEEEQPMPPHLRNKHIPGAKSAGQPARAQAGSWSNIKRRKENAFARSRTSLHAQVTSSLVVFTLAHEMHS